MGPARPKSSARPDVEGMGVLSAIRRAETRAMITPGWLRPPRATAPRLTARAGGQYWGWVLSDNTSHPSAPRLWPRPHRLEGELDGPDHLRPDHQALRHRPPPPPPGDGQQCGPRRRAPGGDRRQTDQLPLPAELRTRLARPQTRQPRPLPPHAAPGLGRHRLLL